MCCIYLFHIYYHFLLFFLSWYSTYLSLLHVLCTFIVYFYFLSFLYFLYYFCIPVLVVFPLFVLPLLHFRGTYTSMGIPLKLYERSLLWTLVTYSNWPRLITKSWLYERTWLSLPTWNYPAQCLGRKSLKE